MSEVFSGSRASLKLNGTKVVYVSSISINHQNTLTPIDVIDQLEVAEHAETGHVVNFSCNLFKVDANAAAALGLDPANLDDILTQGEMTMEVYDRVSQKARYEMTGVKFEGGSGSVDARGVWTGSWNFQGRRGRGI